MIQIIEFVKELNNYFNVLNIKMNEKAAIKVMSEKHLITNPQRAGSYALLTCGATVTWCPAAALSLASSGVISSCGHNSE